MKKLNSVSIILMMLLSVLSVAFIPSSTGSVITELPDYEPLEIGADIRNAHYGIDPNTPLMSASSSFGPMSAGEVGDIAWFLALDDYMGYYFWQEFELRSAGPRTEIWVQLDLSFPDNRSDPVVTQEQLDYLLDEFETNIYEKTTAAFGIPDVHDGTLSPFGDPDYINEEGKNIIMISNVRDDAYYDPTYPYYIAGFYSPTFEYYIDRNIITIDTNDWENRIGPDGLRPYLYESIIAHEYQHLIHADYNPEDPSWMNEACSLYAEPLCGYPIDWGQVNRFLETPDNSLVEWGEQGDRNILADYGSSFLWAMYLSDHYGGFAFLAQFVQAGIPGVAGIEAALDFFGYEDDFDDVYHDWRIANLINADYGKYGYTSLDLSEAENTLRIYDAGTAPMDWTKGTDFGTSVSYDGDDTGIAMVGPYGTDYIKFDYEKKRSSWNRLYFDGEDDGYESADSGWAFNGAYWNSGDTDLLNTLLFDEVFIDPADPTLYLTTAWDIEDYWDFGFVQVSTDDGATWTSLANEWTTFDHDPNAHPDIIASLPGITEWYGMEIVDMTFDLTAYAGLDVQVGFRYMTDWGTTFSGWYIFDSYVGGTQLELEKFIQNYPADFMVSVVAFKEMPWGLMHFVRDVNLQDGTNEGFMRQYGAWMDYFVIIVSPLFEAGLIDYSFKVASVKPGRNWCK